MHKEKKKLKIIIAIILILILIVLLIIGLLIYKNLVEGKSEKASIDEFEDVKEIIEYNECKYIKTESSKEDDFEEDIYIEFSKDVIEEDGKTNEILYDNLVSQIAGKMKGRNFRLIDETRNLIIRIKYTDQEVSTYTINNDQQYFEHLKTRYQLSNYSVGKDANIQILSQELNSIINNNWQSRNINIGTRDSICNGYNIYFDEGYKIRNIYNKIYNIIFTKQYTKEVFNGIKTGMTNEEIVNILGDPTFKGSNSNMIGYKNQTIYVFFNDGEISIYRNEQNYELEEFEKLVEELNETNDYNSFVSKLTEMWPDYDSFTKVNNRVRLQYSLKGIVIDFNAISNSGITFYNNVNPKLLEDIQNGEKIPANLYTELDSNLISITEDNRVMSDELARIPIDPNYDLDSNDYAVGYTYNNEDKSYSNVSFLSKNKEKIDTDLKEGYVNDLYKLDDSNYIYSINNRGIYKFNISNLQYQTIIEGTGAFDIKNIENNIIYYNDTQIEIR